MALTFPQNPAVNDVYTFQDVSYVWDGNKWTSKSYASGLPILPDADGNVIITGNLTVNGDINDA